MREYFKEKLTKFNIITNIILFIYMHNMHSLRKIRSFQ
jgi:hypothetical protein